MALRLSDSNLYAGGELIVLPDGTEILERDLSARPDSIGDGFVLFKEDDTLPLIAGQNWGAKIGSQAQDYWWLVADNMTDLENPLDLTAFEGAQVRIPDLPLFLASEMQ